MLLGKNSSLCRIWRMEDRGRNEVELLYGRDILLFMLWTTACINPKTFMYHFASSIPTRFLTVAMYETEPTANHITWVLSVSCKCLPATLDSSLMWKKRNKTMNVENGWESLFRRGLHSFTLHQNTFRGESGSVRLYSSTLEQRSGWMMPKGERMGTRKWSENRCRIRVLKILPKFLL